MIQSSGARWNVNPTLVLVRSTYATLWLCFGKCCKAYSFMDLVFFLGSYFVTRVAIQQP